MNSELSVNCDLCGRDDAALVVTKGQGRYVRCRHCGFVYSSPRCPDSMSENQAYFDAHLEQYVEASYSRRKQRAYGRQLRRFESYRRTNRLLEIGSNVGGFLYRARELGWVPTGVEPVADCCEYASREHGLESIASTLEEAGLPPDSFDVIYSNAVFEHLPSPAQVMQTAARLLRPGGVIYTKTVNYGSYTCELLGEEWNLLAPSNHLSLFTPVTLRRFCEQAGLCVVRTESNGVRLPREARGWAGSRVKKALLSARCRFTMKGDRVIVWAERPAK